MAAEDELKDIKEILASIRDQNAIRDAGVATQSALDYKQYAAELKLARDELALLEKGTGAYNRKQKEVERLSGLTKNALKDQRREADMLSLSINGLSSAMDMLGNSIDLVVVKLAGLVSSVMADVKELDNLTVQFQAATGASAKMASNIGGLTDRMRVFGVSNQEAADAVKSLYSNFTLFTRLNETTKEGLLDTVALMGELGVSADTSAQLLESSFRTFGMSVDEANGLLIDLRGTARALEVPVEQLTSDFLAQESVIATLGEEGVDAFKSIAAASKGTGVSVGTLMDGFTKFDDFDAAANIAANLQQFGISLDFMTMQQIEDPLERVKMYRNALLEAGYTADNFTTLHRSAQLALSEAMEMDIPNALKLLRGEFDELVETAEQAEYTFEEMKKDAFGLKGFDQVLNNMMNSFKRPIEEIQKAGRRTFEAFTPTIEMFEKYSDDMLKTTEKFIANNSELVGGIAIAYNLFNLDVIQQSYNAFKGIMSFSGTLLTNMFSFKGLLLGLVGGGFYMIRDQLGDIIDTFNEQGIIGGLKALGSAFLGVFNEFKTKAIAAGFDANFFSKLTNLALDALALGFLKAADYLAPIFDKMKVELILLFQTMRDDGTFDRIADGLGYILTKALSTIPIIGKLFGLNTTGMIAGAAGAFAGAKGGAIAGSKLGMFLGPKGALIGGAVGALGGGIGAAMAGSAAQRSFEGPPETLTREQVTARVAAQRAAGSTDLANRLSRAEDRFDASLTAYSGTAGARTVEQKAAVVMEKTGKVMDVIEPRLTKVSTTMNEGFVSVKEGIVEGLGALVETLEKMNTASTEAHNEWKRGLTFEIDSGLQKGVTKLAAGTVGAGVRGTTVK